MSNLIPVNPEYGTIHSEIVKLLDAARVTAARSVNSVMTATYWEIGRRIVEFEQGGQERAAYGEALIERLSDDLTKSFGRGFSRQNLQQMRLFYLSWPTEAICQTVSGKSLNLATLTTHFQLPWSAYVRLLSVKNETARRFYESEALRCGWSVRQLDRQVSSQFYERIALSHNKAAMLQNGGKSTLNAGQMHMYLNYAKAHWMKPGENPPIGLILCAEKGNAEAHYALDGLPNKILAAEYKTVLPDEKLLADEIEKTQQALSIRKLETNGGKA